MGKGKIRAIKKALRKPELYDKEEYQYLMSNFYEALVEDELKKQTRKRKGFGYVERKIDLGDSESGGDDWLRSESEQPEQPGEPEGSGAA